MRPSYIGIGAQECASAWIPYILQDHPQAFVSTPLDINFFSYNYAHGLQWYEKHFEKGAGLKALGEISASYFYDLSAPVRAYRYNPNFKIIVLLKDPIERAYSNHVHEIHTGNYISNDLSFETGLINNPMYIEQSYYASHITRWLQFFPRERILILIEEEIYARPEEQAKRVYNFLDINESHECDYLNKLSSQSQPKSVQMEAMFKKLGSLGRKTGMENWVTAAKNNSLVSAMRQVNTNELKQTVPPMRPETWSFLQEEFIDEIVELADLLGRVSFPWPTWSVKKRAGAVKGESRQVLSS